MSNEINFQPLVDANRRAKSLGVPASEIERNLDDFLADVRKAVLAEAKHVTWVFTTPQRD